ncbi:VOC family protein [Streptomyces sp. AF1A]|uniref:VOC family protein n=1 Tax=Streptomyces sp. AF1A TaxID=3394350 RepID=UPI0039BCE23D
MSIDAAYAAMRERGARIMHPPADEERGVRRFSVRDPDGHAVGVGPRRPGGRRGRVLDGPPTTGETGAGPDPGSCGRCPWKRKSPASNSPRVPRTWCAGCAPSTVR